MTLESFRSVLRNAIGRKKVPAYHAGSTRDLSLKLGLSPPISLVKLSGTLNTLPPATVSFSSPPLTANFLHGSASVGVQSDGMASFVGSVHEAGVLGDNYVLAAALLDVKDARGNTLVFVQTGSVQGQLDIGSSDASWQIDGLNQLLADQWDNVKKGHINWQLHASTDPLTAVEPIVIGLLAAVGVVAVAMFAGDSDTHCVWGDGTSLVNCQR